MTASCTRVGPGKRAPVLVEAGTGLGHSLWGNLGIEAYFMGLHCRLKESQVDWPTAREPINPNQS